MQDIGKHIRQQRLRQNMTQDDLAQRIHATRQTVSNYETGRSRPDIDTLHLLAQALECDIQILLYGQAHAKMFRIHFTTLPLSAVLCVLLLLAEPALQAVVHSPITTERAAAFVLPLALGARFLGNLMIGWLLADVLLLLFKLDLSHKLCPIKLRPLLLYVMLAYCLLLLLNMVLLPILPVGGFTRLLSAVLLRLSDTWPLAILLGALRRCTLAPK